MPNWIGAIEKAGQLAAEEFDRAASGKGENFLSLFTHGSSASGSAESKITGSVSSQTLKDLHADTLAIGDGTSSKLPQIVIEDAAKKSRELSANGRTIYPWEHPLRASPLGYDPWLEGI